MGGLRPARQPQADSTRAAGPAATTLRTSPGPPGQPRDRLDYRDAVKEAGIWKIKLLSYNMLWQATYADGWAHSGVHLAPLTRTFPEDPNGPDELLPDVPKTWPGTRPIARTP